MGGETPAEVYEALFDALASPRPRNVILDDEWFHPHSGALLPDDDAYPSPHGSETLARVLRDVPPANRRALALLAIRMARRRLGRSDVGEEAEDVLAHPAMTDYGRLSSAIRHCAMHAGEFRYTPVIEPGEEEFEDEIWRFRRSPVDSFLDEWWQAARRYMPVVLHARLTADSPIDDLIKRLPIQWRARVLTAIGVCLQADRGINWKRGATVADIAALGAERLLACPNFGAGSLATLRQALGTVALTLE